MDVNDTQRPLRSHGFIHFSSSIKQSEIIGPQRLELKLSSVGVTFSSLIGKTSLESACAEVCQRGNL